MTPVLFRIGYRLVVAVACLCCLLDGNSPAFGGQPTGPLASFGVAREWSDASGKFKINASMVEADSTQVRLKKSDGRVVAVPVNKLSQPDQAFIKAFLAAEAALPASGGSANPFAGGEMASEPAPATNSPRPSSTSAPAGSLSDIPMREMSDRGAVNVTIDFGEPFWDAGDVSALTVENVPNRSVTLPMPKEFFAGVSMKVTGKQPVGLFSIYRQDRKPENNYTRLGRYDIIGGEASALGQAEQPWKILAATRDGALMAVVRIEGFDKGNDVAILKVNEDSVTPIYQFKAGGGSFAEVRWAGFLANDRLVSIDQKHRLTVWDLRSSKVTHQASVGDQTMSAVIGGNGELVAIPGSGVIAFLDGKSLRQVGTIQLDTSVKPSIAFSPDGKYLACYTPFAVEVFGLADGEAVKRIAVPNGQPGVRLDWVGNNVLLDSSLLVDVQNGRPWWTYQTQNKPTAVHGGQLYVLLPDKGSSTLVMNKIPHPAAERAVSRANPADLLALTQGSQVALSLQLNGLSPAEQQRVRSAFEAKIRENGWRLASNSANRVELTLEQGGQQSEEYVESRGFGPPIAFGPRRGPTTTVNFRPWLHKIMIKVGGQEVFSSQRTVGAPSSISAQEGKTTQQIVNEKVKPSSEFFVDARLPREVVKPEYRQGFGTSRVTADGLQ